MTRKAGLRFLLQGKQAKKMLVGSRCSMGVDMILMWVEFKQALEGCTNLDKINVKLDESHDLAYEDLILSINTNSSVRSLHLDWFKMLS